MMPKLLYARLDEIGTDFAVSYPTDGRAGPSAHHKRGQPHGSRLGHRRWPVERSLAWVLQNRRLALRYDTLGFIIQSLLQSACIFLVAGRLAREF
jgi:transposase